MLLFMVSFWGLSQLTVERDTPAGPSTSYLDQLVAGFRHLLERTDLRLLLALTALNGLLGRTIIELLPALSGQVLRGGSADLAVLVAMAGLGSVWGLIGEPAGRGPESLADTGMYGDLASCPEPDQLAVVHWVDWIGGMGVQSECGHHDSRYRVTDADTAHCQK